MNPPLLPCKESVPALPLDQLGGCLGRWANRGRQKGQKYNCLVQKVTNVHQEKIMNVIKVNEAHVHTVYEKREIRHYFRLASRRVNIFPMNLNFTYTRCVMWNFGTNFLHVTNFSNVATAGIREKWPQFFLCPANSVVDGKLCFKHRVNRKIMPPKNAFCHQSMTTWLRVCADWRYLYTRDGRCNRSCLKCSQIRRWRVVRASKACPAGHIFKLSENF